MRLAIASALALAFGPSAVALAEAPAERESLGWIESEEMAFEILPPAPPAGTTLHLPEGWIRVEEAPEDEGDGSGSFGVVRTRRLPPPPAPEEREERAPPPPPAEPWWDVHPPDGELHDVAAGNLGPCYGERERYVEELLRIAGIDDVEHPLALLEGLGMTPGLSPWVRFNLFGLPGGGPWNGVSWIDPVRPLAWDDGLRYAARDLERCMRRSLGFDDRLVDPDLLRPPPDRPAPAPGPQEAPTGAPRRLHTL